jgi:hypothetical protein
MRHAELPVFQNANYFDFVSVDHVSDLKTCVIFPSPGETIHKLCGSLLESQVFPV